MKERDVLFVYDEIGKDMEIPVIREELTPYLAKKRQGEFTTEDYFALPEEHRVELIDGVIYYMATPVSGHQGIADEIRETFNQFIKKNKGRCFTLTSPVSVQLDCDNKTMVQPDVLIVCDRNKFQRSIIYGAPDLIVEVLSPSTRKKDLTIKLRKYRNAGVREYWIVDQKHKQVIVHEVEKGNLTTIYTFEDKVPVGIFDGECMVDFKEIYEYVGFLYEPDPISIHN